MSATTEDLITFLYELERAPLLDPDFRSRLFGLPVFSSSGGVSVSCFAHVMRVMLAAIEENGIKGLEKKTRTTP